MAAQVSARSLRDALKAVRHAVATDMARPILGSILFDGDEEALRVVASDNYRLAVAVVDTGDWSTMGKRPVPHAQVRLLQAALVGQDYATLEAVDIPRPLLRMVVDRGTVEVAVTDSPYPNWRSITTDLAKPGRSPLAISPEYLADALRAAQGMGGKAVAIEHGGRLEVVIVRAGGDLPYTEWVVPSRGVS